MSLNPTTASAPTPAPGHKSCQGQRGVQDAATAAAAPEGPEEAVVPSVVTGWTTATAGWSHLVTICHILSQFVIIVNNFS